MKHTIGLFGTFTGYEQMQMVKEAISLGYAPVLISHNDYEIPKEVAALATACLKTRHDFESEIAVNDILTQLETAKIRLTAVFPAIETGVIMAGLVANRLHVPWNAPSTVRMFRNKVEQRARLQAAGISNPRLFHFTNRNELNDILPNIRFPSVFKPASGFGKVGVRRVNSAAELLEAFDHFSNNEHSHYSLVSFGGGFLIEEFISGQKLTVEILIADEDRLMPVVVSESTVVGAQFLEMGHAVPCSFEDFEQDRIKSYALNAVKALNVTRGVVHLELLRQPDGALFVIEANGRCPGGRLTSLIREASGTNYLRAALRVAVEGILPEPFHFAQSAAVHWFLRPSGTLREIVGFEGLESAPGFLEKYISVKVGDKMLVVGDAVDRVGFCMCGGMTTPQAKIRARALASSVQLITDSDAMGVA